MSITPTGENPYAGKKPRQSPEMVLQAKCIKRAWNDFPETRKLLFHVENEAGKSDPIMGARRRAEGIVKGVSDLILLIPRGKWHGLCIEMKYEDGYWRKEQREWAELVRTQGYRYEVIRSEEDFVALLTEYLTEK